MDTTRMHVNRIRYRFGLRDRLVFLLTGELTVVASATIEPNGQLTAGATVRPGVDPLTSIVREVP